MPVPVKRCDNETLASGPVAKIERCRGCGVVSIHIGPTTLRLDGDGLTSLWATIEEALTEIHSAAPGSLAQVWTGASTRGSA